MIAPPPARRLYQPAAADPLRDAEDDEDDEVYETLRRQAAIDSASAGSPPGSGGSAASAASLQQRQSATRGFRESYRPASGNTLDLRPATAADTDAVSAASAPQGAAPGGATREVDLSALSADLFSPKAYVTSPTRRVPHNLLTEKAAGVGIGVRGHPKVGLWSASADRPPSRQLPPAEALHLFSNTEAAGALSGGGSSRPHTAVVKMPPRPFSRRSRQRPRSGPSGLSEEERNRLHRTRPPSRGRPPPETLQL